MVSASPFEIHETAVATGIAFEAGPMRYKKEKSGADADGMNWLTHDPDGNNIFFDTNELELRKRAPRFSPTQPPRLSRSLVSDLRGSPERR